jgi:hypothetical protein
MMANNDGIKDEGEGSRIIRNYGSIRVVPLDDVTATTTTPTNDAAAASNSYVILHERHFNDNAHPATTLAAAAVDKGDEDDDAPSPSGRLRRSFSRSVSHHWTNYMSFLEEKPLLTKGITATIILGGADLIAQGLQRVRNNSTSTNHQHHHGGVDWLRAARFAAFGLFGAPWSHYYFQWLDHYLPPTDNPWTTTTLFKVIIDQFLQAPLLLAVMIVALGFMKGEGIGGTKRDMDANFIDALIANCKVCFCFFHRQTRNEDMGSLTLLL